MLLEFLSDYEVELATTSVAATIDRVETVCPVNTH